MTVTILPRFRFSTESRAVCFSGGFASAGTGSQTHSSSILPQRSHVGSLYKSVPAKILIEFPVGLSCGKAIESNS